MSDDDVNTEATSV